MAYFALTAPTFPCRQALRIFDPPSKYTALAILWSTFGSDLSCLQTWAERMEKLDIPHTLLIHLSNETCRRENDRICTDSELSPQLPRKRYYRLLEQRDPSVLDPLVARIREVREAVSKLKSKKLQVILSTGLEDNYSPEAYAVIVAVMRAEWPYKIVRNPVGNLPEISSAGADFLELHGPTPSFSKDEACIANLDGDDINFPGRPSPLHKSVDWQDVITYVQRYERRCRITFLWSAAWQGIFSEVFVPPQKRIFKVPRADIKALRSIP